MTRRYEAGDWLALSLAFAIPVSILAGAVGWVLNIVKIAGADGFSGLLVLRCIGIFLAPIGAVLGFV